MTGPADHARTSTVDVHVDAEAFVVDLADLGAADLERVGGKAANLGELIRAGFDVPAGFCVTTAGYRLAVEPTAVATGRLSDAAAARAAVLAADAASRRRRAGPGRLPRTGPGWDDAGRGAVVRDRRGPAGASFAGQQDTYLNVVGVDAVLDAVHRCWASLWTDRAVAYRAAQGIDGADVALAVVVQRDGRRAGAPACCSPPTRSPGGAGRR